MIKLTDFKLRERGCKQARIGVKSVRAMIFMERIPRTIGEIQIHLRTRKGKGNNPLPKMPEMWTSQQRDGDACRYTLSDKGKEYLAQLRAEGFKI